MQGTDNTTPRSLALWTLLACGTGMYFFANIQRVAIPGAIFNQLQAEFDASASAITGLGSSFMYIYAVNQLLIGMLIDRYGGIRTIMVGGVVFCLGCFAFPLAHTLPMLYIGRILTGFGASAIYLSLIKEIMRCFDKNYPIMVSIMILFGYAGGIVANAPFVAAAARLGYRPVLLIMAALSLALYLGFAGSRLFLTVPEIKDNVTIKLRNFAAVLKRRHNVHLFIFAGINWGLYYVIQTVLGKKFLEDFGGLAPMTAATVLSLLGLISASCGFLFAVLSRLLGNRRQIFCRLAGFVSIGSFGALTALVFLDLRTPVLSVLFCLLSLTGSMSSIAIPLLRETNPEEQVGLAISFMNFGFFLAVAFFGNLAGLLMDAFAPQPVNGIMVYGREAYLTVFAVLFLFSGLVFACSWQMRETFGRKIAVE